MLSASPLWTYAAGQGLLSFTSGTTTGAERTGWIDVRHPVTGELDRGALPTDPINTSIGHGSLASVAASTTSLIGYDRSDYFVEVHSNVVSAKYDNGYSGPATPQYARDFDYANQIWAQAGITVLNVGIDALDLTGPTDVKLGLSESEQIALQGVASTRAADPAVVNNWYVAEGTKNYGVVYLGGRTLSPSGSLTASGMTIFNEANGVAFAHELGHFILNRFDYPPEEAATATDTSHTNVVSDLMHNGGPTPTPTTLKHAAQNTAFLNSGVSYLGLDLDGVPAASPIVAVHNASDSLAAPTYFFVQRTTGNDATYGDRIDFHWVEDNAKLSGAAATDPAAFGYLNRRPDLSEGTEPLRWGIASLAPAPSLAGHDLDNWLVGAPVVPAYSGGTFNTVDVFSQIARYADNDGAVKDVASDKFRREAALDYEVYFSADGVAWVAGRVAQVFDDGWTMASNADDFVARWWSPVAAQHVRVQALGGKTNDGNAQIDAVVAGVATNVITGTVFQEGNPTAPNGDLDTGDRLLKGVLVKLDHATNNSLDREVLTDTNGTYAFTDLAPGETYRVVVTQPNATLFTTQGADTNDLKSHVDGTGQSNPLTVPTVGTLSQTINAGTIDTSGLRKKELKSLVELLGGAAGGATDGTDLQGSAGSSFLTQSDVALSLAGVGSLPDLPFLGSKLTDAVDLEGLFNQFAAGMSEEVSLAADSTPASFTLANDALFGVSVNGAAPLVVRVGAAQTTDNTTASDLAVDLTLALSLGGLSDSVTAIVLDDGRLAIQSIDGAGVEELSIATLRIKGDGAGIDPDVAPYGQLSATLGAITNLSIDIDGVQYVVTKVGVTPPGVSEAPFVFTQDNASLEDLADDLNAAFLTAVSTSGAAQPLTAVFVAVDPGANLASTADDRLVLVAADPEASSIKVVANGARLGFANGVIQTATTNSNPAVTAMGFGVTSPAASASQGTRVIADAGFFSVDTFVEAAVEQMYALSNLPLPADFDPDPVWNDATKTLEFNFALNHVFSSAVDLDFFDGFNLGSLLGTLEVAALAQGSLDVQVNLNMRVGFMLGDIGAGFTVTPGTSLASLNGGDGVGLLVGMTAANAAPALGAVGSDANFSLAFTRAGGDVENVSLTLPENPLTSELSLPIDQRTPNTDDNTTVETLTTDLNKLFSQKIDGDGRVLSTVLEAGVFESVASSGAVTRKLTLRAIDPTVLGMTLTGGSQLGFAPVATSDWRDLSVVLSNGAKFDVNLDGVETLGQAMAAIEAASEVSGAPRVDVVINGDMNGIDVIDFTTGAVLFGVSAGRVTLREEEQPSAPFTYIATSTIGSPAGLGLGVLGAEEDVSAGIVAGTPLHGLGLADRLYIVESAPTHKHLTITATVSAEFDVTAALGEIALDLNTVDSDPLTFTIEVGVHLSDPDSSGEIFVNEFTPNDLPGIVSATMLAAQGSGSIEVGVNVFDEDDLLDLEALLGESSPAVKLGFMFDTSLGQFRFTADSNFATLWDQFKDLGVEDFVALLDLFVDELRDNPDLGFLNEDVPIINRSLDEVLEFADGLLDGANRLVSGISLDDLADIEQARLALETAVANLGMSLDEREFLLKQLEVLRRVAAPPDQDAPVDFFDRLPARLLSAVAHFGKLIHQQVATDVAGYGDLIVAFKELARQAPAFNSIEDRLADALEDAINDALDTPEGSPLAVDVRLGFADFDGVTTTALDRDDRMIVLGVEIAAPQLVTRTLTPEAPISAEVGPITLSLDAELEVVAGGVIAFGLAIDPRQSIDDDRFFLIVDPPTSTTDDLVKTSLDLGLGIDSHAEGEAGFGSFGLIDVAAEFTALDAVRQVEAPAANIQLDGTPVYYRGATAYNDDGRSMIVVVKNSTTGDADVLSFSAGEYRLSTGGPPTLQILHSSIDLVTEATEVVIEYQTKGDHAPPTPETPQPNTPGTRVNGSNIDLMRAANHPAGFSFQFAPNAPLGNALGAVAFGDIDALTTIDTDIRGMLLASFDAELLGNNVDNLLVVAASLNHLLQPQLTFDADGLGSLFQLDFDLKTIVAGMDRLLAEIEQAMTESVANLPLAGDGLDIDATFVGKLRNNFTIPFLDFLCNTAGSLDDVEAAVQQFIFDKLGPGGLRLLADRNGNSTISLSDVYVDLDENHFDIDIALGGHEEFQLDFSFNENFPLQGEGGVTFGWDFAVAFGVGVSRTEGFYFLDHQAGSYGLTATTPELSLVIDAGLAVDLSVPGAPLPTSLELGLFGLSLSATDILDGNNTGTYINGTLTIDVTDDTLDGKIHLAELGSRPLTDVFLASMVATAEVNLRLALGVNDNLPSVETMLFIGTDSGSGPGPWTATLDSSTGSYQFALSDLTIQFRDLGINLGDFLSDHLGSVVRSVDKYIEPIKPVVKLLTTEVPGVSQLSVAAGNGPVDFLDLAFLDNPTAGAHARKFVDTVTTIIDVVDSLASIDPSDNLFVVLDDLIEVPTPGFSIAYASEYPIDPEEQFVAALTGGIVSGVQNVQGKLAGLLDRLHEIGVQIHLIEEPTNIVNMLLGQPFDVVSWELPRFDLPFTFEAEFPVIPVPKINVRVGLNANVFAEISVGYDSHGLDTGNFFHGFYFGDREDVFTGADIDEFGLGMGVTLAALLDLLVVKAGVEGEVRADVFANWRDSDNDGKLHADEIASIVRNDGFACLFDLHGEVRAIVRAVWEFTITGSTGSKEFINEVLFAFMHECPKYETGHVSEGETLPGIAAATTLDPSFADFNTAGTLVLHAGAYAGLRGPGATSDTSEAFEVEELVPPSASNGMMGVYAVRALGLESRYSGVKRIYFDGGIGNDRLELINVTAPVVAFGGAGDDALQGTKNIDLLDGGGGNDVIFGRGAGDFLFGGAGADVIYGDLEAGNSNTALWGLGAADTIDAGAGDDLVYAGDGGDLVYAGAGADIVYADLKEAGVLAALQGADEVHGGAGDDILFSGGMGDFLYGDAGRDLLFGEGGDDLVDGGTGADLVMGDHGDDMLYGGSSIDVVVGGLGADQLFGGRGNDVLAGGLATASAPLAAAVAAVLLDSDLYADVVARETTDYLATDGDDELWGEEDNDFLVGDDGDDKLFGGWGDDAIVGHRVAELSLLYSEYIEGGPGDDFICAGGGPDEIYGGTADAGIASILASVPATQSLGWFFLESCESTEVVVTLPPTSAGVAGVKFNDLDGDGVRDADEPLLAGWTINLLDPDGEVIDSAVTDANGAYAFTSLEPGDYGLSEDSQVDWVQTAGGATLTLVDGDDATGYDFGNRFNGAKILGRKWHDVNGNGVFDSGEPGLDNWVIELLDESGAVVASTHTFAIDLDGSGSDAIDNDYDDNPLSNLDDGFAIDEADERFSPDEHGFYEFTGLPSGVYAVREVALAGWIQSSPRLTEPGTFVVLPDDGYTALRSDAQSAVPGSVTSVSVAFDIDHALRSDLSIDLIAPSGARVTLLDGVGGSVQNFSSITMSDSATVAIADISANPSASTFKPAEALTSLVGESATGQWTLELRDNIEGTRGRLNDWSIVINGVTINGGAPNIFRAGDTVAVTVVAVAGGVTTENFGNYRPGTVTGIKFLDRDGNGQRNADGPGGPEPGLGGVVIYADLNNNGLLDRGEPKTITLLDDPNTQGIDETGQYVLNGLPPRNSLVIREVVADGLTPTFPTPIVAGSGSWLVNVTSGQVVEGYDFGNAPAASVHGQKWLDSNRNGVRDPNEEGLDGVLIYADLNNNGVLDAGEPTSVTHSVASTLPQPGDYNGDGSANAADYTVWRDAVGAGVPGDLRADGDRNGVVDVLDYAVWVQNYGQTAAVVTSTGHYCLEDIPAGTVTVREAPYPGLAPTTPTGGAYFLTLEFGEVREGIDFGNAPAASVHGQKWLDANGNGVRDPGEAGLNGVVIYADLDNDGAFDPGEPTSVTHSVTTTTTPPGDYNSDGSVNGADYTVWRDAQATYIPGTTPTGGDGDGDGDIDSEDYAVWRNNYGGSFAEVTSDGHYWLDGLPAGEVVIREAPVDEFHPTFPELGFYILSLAIGEAREGIDFGNAPTEQQSGSISGVKVFDENGNRHPDDLATPMQGVTIYVDMNNDGSFNPALEPSAVTGASGGYTIQNVPAGMWRVRESVPPNYQQVYPAAPGYHVVTVAPGQGVVGVDFANTGVAALPAIEPVATAAASAAGLVAFWNFENDLVDTAAGFTQNVGVAGDDLVPAGPVNVTFAAGQVGSAVVVSPGAWVSTTVTGDLNLPEFTLEALVRPSQGPGGVIAETQSLASGIDFRVRWGNGLVRLQALSGGSVIASSTAFPMPAGVWSHVAVVGAGVDLSLYVDGTFVDSVTVGAPIGIETADRLVWGGQEFVGTIDKGAVWGIPLTAAELTDHAMFPQDCYGLTPLGATGEIHGTKFLDADGDGLRGAAEGGLAGWTIMLTGADFNHDGVIDLNDVLTTTTDATGAYWFTGLESATYTVAEAQQPGWTQTSNGGFGIGGVLAPTPGRINWEIILGGQESYFEVDFGNHSTRVASVHGQKWRDANANGNREPGEVGLDGWVIELYDASGAQVRSTVTMSMDINQDGEVDPITERGLFWFDDVAPGAYTVGEVLVDGWRQTVPSVVGLRRAGDANQDGLHDVADLAIVAEWGLFGSGLPASWSQGDFNNNGVVDQADLAAALANIGQTSFTAADRRVSIQVGPGQTVTGVEFANYEPTPLPDGDDRIFARAGNDTVRGDNLVSDPTVISVGTRRDTIYGQGGSDRLFGQEEEDVLWGADGMVGVVGVGVDDDHIHGGEGIDEVRQTVDTNQVLTNTLLSGQGADTLVSIERGTLTGGASNNTITAAAFSGPVTLIGLGGNDSLNGGVLGDLLVGGAGNDSLVGGDGDDTYLFGPVTSVSPDLDTIDEGAGPMSGTDTLDFSTLDVGVTVDLSGALPANQIALHAGGGGRHISVAVAGEEMNLENVVGTLYDDLLIGNAANNVLAALDGSDDVRGGAGNDLLNPGPGVADVADGGANDDRIVFHDNWGGATIADSGGFDSVDFSTVTTPLDALVGSLVVTSGPNTVTHAGSDFEFILGGQADDVFRFADGATLPAGGRIEAGSGTDLLDYSAYSTGVTVNLTTGAATGAPGGVAEFENVTGGQGGDSLTGDGTANVLDGGIGDDPLLDGRAGNDTLLGGDGDDGAIGILGGDGDDLLVGGAGDDLNLDGGNGADTVAVRNGDGSDSVADTGPASESDTLDLSQVTTNLVFNMATGTLSVTFPSAGDVLTAANAFENVLSGSGDDLVKFAGVASLPAGATLDGGGGRNTLDYSAYTVGVLVNLGNDPLVAPAIAPHTVTGASSVVRFRDVLGSNQGDVIVGDQLANNLSGLGGNDKLYGGSGADMLAGGSGSDDLFGGAGDDRYVLTPGFTGVTLNEFNGVVSAGQATAGGVDTIDISALTFTLPVDLSTDIEFENVLGSLTARNVLTGNAKDNLLIGGASGDKILGGDGADFLIGQGGSDWLEGGAGDDILHGGDGADGVGLDLGLQRLFLGGPGSDVLIGGDGADSIDADDNEEDIVVSGLSAYDNVGVDPAHRTAWLEIREVWASTTRDRALREALVAAGVGTVSMGGPFLLTAVTVTDDGDADTISYDSTASSSPVDDLVFSDFTDSLTASLISGDAIAALSFAISEDQDASGPIAPMLRASSRALHKSKSPSSIDKNLLMIQNGLPAMPNLHTWADDSPSPNKRRLAAEESLADGVSSSLRRRAFESVFSDWG